MKFFSHYFIPDRSSIATHCIVYLNIILFVIMVAGGVDITWPDSESLMRWGANNRYAVLEGEYWRLITSSFLHIGIFHLFLNMASLLYIGKQVEPLVGPVRFLLIYFAFAITSSIASIAWHTHAVSAGASGALFGLIGFFFGCLLFKVVEFENRNSVLAQTGTIIVVNLLYGISGLVDNAGHIGGLITGFAVSILGARDLVKSEEYRRGLAVPAILIIAVCGITWMGISMTPNHIKYYNEKMKLFDIRENQSLEVYTRAASLPKDELLYEINERGLYYLEENMKVLKELERLSLPEEIEQRNRLLKEYCKRRIASYHLYSQAVHEETDKYKPEIDKLDKEIEDLLKLLQP